MWRRKPDDACSLHLSPRCVRLHKRWHIDNLHKSSKCNVSPDRVVCPPENRQGTRINCHNDVKTSTGATGDISGLITHQGRMNVKLRGKRSKANHTLTTFYPEVGGGGRWLRPPPRS